MQASIPDILMTRKARDIAVVAALVLLGGTAFGLGRLSVQQNTADQQPAMLCAGVEALTPRTAITDATPETGAAAQGEQGSYVASKNGSVYHLPWCSGALRIRDENKIWFATKQAAESAGYRPAANCKGL